MDITGWRRKIDEIDTAMLHLLNLRAELAIEVARMKNQEGVALRTPSREREILSRMKRLNPGPFDGQAVAKIYQLILAESNRNQELHCRPLAETPGAKSRAAKSPVAKKSSAAARPSRAAASRKGTKRR